MSVDFNQVQQKKDEKLNDLTTVAEVYQDTENDINELRMHRSQTRVNLDSRNIRSLSSRSFQLESVLGGLNKNKGEELEDKQCKKQRFDEEISSGMLKRASMGSQPSPFSPQIIKSLKLKTSSKEEGLNNDFQTPDLKSNEDDIAFDNQPQLLKVTSKNYRKDSIIYEDEDEERPSNSYVLSPIERTPQDTQNSFQYLQSERSITEIGDTQVGFQTDHKFTSDPIPEQKQIIPNEKTITEQSYTKNQLLVLREEIIKENKSVLTTLRASKKKLENVKLNIIRQNFAENQKSIEKLSSKQSKVFSLITRNIRENEDLFSNINYENSLFYIEGELCSLMKSSLQTTTQELIK